MTQERSLALVSNLNKIFQQLAKTVPPGSEQQIFGDDLRKRIEGIGNNKQFFERENAYYSNKKNSKRFPQILETFTRNSTNNTKATDTTSIAPTVAPAKRGNSQRSAFEERQHCVNFMGKLKIMKTGKSTPKISIFLAQPRRT